MALNYGNEGGGVIVEKAEMSVTVGDKSCPEIHFQQLLDLVLHYTKWGDKSTDWEGEKMPVSIEIKPDKLSFWFTNGRNASEHFNTLQKILDHEI